MQNFSVSGTVVDVHQKRMYAAKVQVKNGRIESIEEGISGEQGPYILPGFVDSHVHIESSMLIPVNLHVWRWCMAQLPP